ncbi:MAG: sugar ABC transporter ATP-binding protein [Christensenellales bacterium]
MKANMPLLEMRGVSKAFPGVKALDRVDFSVYPGEVLALVGENGAGKSTLMKILSGIYKMDEGEILFEGKPIDISGPLASQQAGISIIYQELNVLNNLNIAENLFVGREILNKNGLVDKQRTHQEARKLLDEVKLPLDTHTIMGRLSTAQKQMVEVARALSFNARMIIMDEPTSSLTETETQTLYDIIRQLKASGVAVVFISHRMVEIFQISDRVVVLRDGQMITSLETAKTDEAEIISAMVGRDIDNLYDKEDAPLGEVVLEVRNLSTKDNLKDINFTLRAGEILGFAGLVGAGRSEVMRAVFGIDPRQTGEIFVRGEKADIRNTTDALRYGIGFVPEDRKEQALILDMTVKRNLSLAALDRVSRGWFIDRPKEHSLVEHFVALLQVKTPSVEQMVKNLSGGNQQKVVIAKWLANEPSILILDEPTRGIDVGAKKEIHKLMSELAQQGVAIIMVSSELPEIIGMSDRIIVMHEGRIKGEFPHRHVTQEQIMQMVVS